ncbi:MAG: hypothetical protein ACLUEQ_12585 [Cloacibacillus evryensis]
MPGFTVEYVRTLADIIHKAGALVNVGIHNSQEGTDVETIKRIADNRTAGADMCMLGDAGVNENVALPDVLNPPHRGKGQTIHVSQDVPVSLKISITSASASTASVYLWQRLLTPHKRAIWLLCGTRLKKFSHI